MKIEDSIKIKDEDLKSVIDDIYNNLCDDLREAYYDDKDTEATEMFGEQVAAIIKIKEMLQCK